MAWPDVVATLASAGIGAAAAYGVTTKSMRRGAEIAAAERKERRLASLNAMQFEIEVVKRIAANGSVVVLPTSMLTAAASDLRDLPNPVQEGLEIYAEAVHRYIGRVHRLVEYGAAKRAAGLKPGAERVDDEQMQRVLNAADAAAAVIRGYLATETQSHRSPGGFFTRIRARLPRRLGRKAAERRTGGR